MVGTTATRLRKASCCEAVGDEVLDRDDPEAVLAGEGDELGEPLHRAVVVDDLGEDAGGLEPGEAREIDAGLGVAGALEDAAVAGDQRKDVAGADEILGRGVAARQRPDGRGALGRGDAGGHPDLVVDRDGEGGAERIDVVGDHRLEVERAGAGLGHRHADDAAGVADHEGELLRRRLAGPP